MSPDTPTPGGPGSPPAPQPRQAAPVPQSWACPGVHHHFLPHFTRPLAARLGDHQKSHDRGENMGGGCSPLLPRQEGRGTDAFPALGSARCSRGPTLSPLRRGTLLPAVPSATSGGHLDGWGDPQEENNSPTAQTKQRRMGRAGREASRSQAAAFIALPGTPPSLVGREGTNADPVPVRTLAGKGGEEILGAALALPKPSSCTAGGLVWVRKSKTCPQG